MYGGHKIGLEMEGRADASINVRRPRKVLKSSFRVDYPTCCCWGLIDEGTQRAIGTLGMLTGVTVAV